MSESLLVLRGNPILKSGNYNRRVATAVYPKSRIIAYVSP